MTDKQYAYHRDAILRLNSCPHFVGDRELAEQILERFKTEVPEAVMFCWEDTQYICRNESSVETFKEFMRIEREKLTEKLNKLDELLNSI